MMCYSMQGRRTARVNFYYNQVAGKYYSLEYRHCLRRCICHSVKGALRRGPDLLLSTIDKHHINCPPSAEIIVFERIEDEERE